MPKPAANEHVEQLNKARHRLVEIRRAFAKLLAGPFERGKTDDARAKIIETQTIIEAVDRAIEDEGKIDFQGRHEEDAERPAGTENASATMMIRHAPLAQEQSGGRNVF